RSSAAPDIHWAVYLVMQSIMDDIYQADVLAAHEGILDGFLFGSAANFPGSVAPPADPNNTHTATISGSYADTFGRNTQGDGPGTFARKPTGTYLAPGTIATVTVPAPLVDAGYKVRVGCHSWDFSNRPSIKRLDRISATYPITGLQTRVANPHGGGIYIEVPFGANAGVVDVDITGAVRSPYFSAKSFHTTTLGEWQTTERNHTAPWADFQTEKFMMQVPTNWIYALDDPATLLADWDAAMDAMNDLMGFPYIRGKETMYPQVDILNRASVFAPGYPSVNTKDNPNNDSYSGYRNHHLVRGPQFAPDYEFHEQGHAYFFPKFGGESESAVNLHHVAVQHRKFGETLDRAFAESRGFGGNPNRTLDNTAVAWMCCFNFSPREVPMADWEKAYQLKGHAKFVDIVRIFGTWDGLDEFFRSYMEDDENGTLPANPASTDELLLRMCRSTGVNILPLFHFWGIVPQDRLALRATLASEGIMLSTDILNRLNYYATLVPADNAAFQAFATGWWGSPPSINGFATEREHARQWDATPLYGTGDQQRSEATNPGEIYNENSAADITGRIDEIIELYYVDLDDTPPSPDPMGFAMPPAATGPDSIIMTATTAEDGNGVEYYFQCLTAGGHDSGWQTSPSYTDTGLAPDTEYSYVVRARDQSPAQNLTADSSPASATTGSGLPSGTLFTEGFEDPDVPGYSQNTVPYNVVPSNVTWVGATQGFGANRRGLTDKAGGDFSAPDPNQQAYAFRYTNSGLTTAQGVIGTLEEDTTYTVTFDVVRDDGLNAGTPYSMELVAFGPGDDNAARNECRGARPGTILATAAGNAPGDGSFATISIDFTPDPGTHAADIGKDLGIRFLGATTSALIDNVQLTAIGPGNSFADWIAGFDVGGQTGLTDDFDLDGLGNGVENLLGTDPSVSSTGLVSGTVSGGTFTFTHPQNPDPATDLTATYRWSKDMANFLADGATDGEGTTVDFTAQLDTPEPGTTTVTATVSGAATGKLFVDVEVTQNP
ncbi:MAG: hypothetical protein HKO57_03275, partial [Akkermansiaceae bacterium]|nr:hypothetical protein [Akkermansiaceae bacterium]